VSISDLGTYKPRVRCYDVHQLSMKFERGLDSDVVQFQFLSEDYAKVGYQDMFFALGSFDMFVMNHKLCYFHLLMLL